MKRYFPLILLLFLMISYVSAMDDNNIADLSLSYENDEVIKEINSPVNLTKTDGQTVSSNVSDESVYIPDNALVSKLVSKEVSSTYGKQVSFSVKVIDNNGNLVPNKLVTFKVAKNTYKINTDSNGVASLKLNYNSGKYIIKYYVDNLSGKNTYIVKNQEKLTVLKWGNVGYVAGIKLLKKNIPNNKLVKQVVKATKKRIPLLMIKAGPGKVVFITAGVHGNELSSQVAAMKMIKYLDETPINGTVYIIPFVNLKAVKSKVRYVNKDYNRIANKMGTIPNNIVKLVVKYKCDSYGDFHTTQPGGIPGKNVVMGSKNPSCESFKLTNFIAKKSNVDKIVYKYAGEKYPGALADNVNKRGIASVICEVKLPHNTLTKKTVNLSFSMMKFLLKFNYII